MKIVVIGGGGLTGKKLVTGLRERGHEAVAASRSSGVNAVTGAGLADVLAFGQSVGSLDIVFSNAEFRSTFSKPPVNPSQRLITSLMDK